MHAVFIAISVMQPTRVQWTKVQKILLSKPIWRKFLTLWLVACFSTLSIASQSKSCRDYSYSESIGEQQLWVDFSYLASNQLEGRKTRSHGAQLTRDYLAQRYSAIGLLPLNGKTDFELTFTYQRGFSDFSGVNMAGYITGKTYPEHYIVVTAHYDHLGKKGNRVYNGADDNASGVAALLSIASYAATHGTQTSIIFLATDAEEQGLYGAKGFVKSPPVPLKAIKANLNLDMLSQNRGKNRLYVTGAKYFPELKPIVAKAIDKAGLCLVAGHRSLQRGSIVSSRTNWRQASDHAAFANVNIPYLFLGVSEHPYYHTVNDTVERINPKFYFAAVDTSLNVFLLMDQMTFDSADK